MLKIFILDKDVQLASFLKSTLGQQKEIDSIKHYPGLDQFFATVGLANTGKQKGLVILDFLLENLDNQRDIQKIKALLPSYKIIVYSDLMEDQYFFEAVESGADAFVVKGGSLEKLVEAIRAVSKGSSYFDPQTSPAVSQLIRQKRISQDAFQIPESIANLLNDREVQMASGILKGLSYKEIAIDNHLSINTVRHYVKSLYKKVGVNTKVKLILKLKSEE